MNNREHKGDKRSILKRRTPLIFLSLSVLCAAVFLLWPETCLTVESGGKMLFACPIGEGESFEVSFMHSLNLSPVTDVIEWTGNGMILRKSIFKTFGAGIPIPSDGIGTKLEHVDGHYELTGIDIPLIGFAIMTQEVPDHRLRCGGREIALLELVGSGKPVDIAVKRVPRIIASLAYGG